MSGIQFELPADALAELEERVTAKVMAHLSSAQQAPEWLSDRTAAAYASVSVSTVKNWRKHGLRHRLIGGLVRIARTDLDAWIASHPSRGAT